MSKAKSAERAPRKRKGDTARNGGGQSVAVAKVITLALAEVQEPAQPRARMRLPAALRKTGLDEWKVAWLLNFKIHCLAQSAKSSDNKLLLDYLKEAARHLDPASSRAASQENAAIEIVHDVPRPDRSEPG